MRNTIYQGFTAAAALGASLPSLAGQPIPIPLGTALGVQLSAVLGLPLPASIGGLAAIGGVALIIGAQLIKRKNGKK